MTAGPRAEPEHRIVVGVDGSAASKAALAWAAEQARLTGAVVEAVTAWEFPAAYGYAAPAINVDWEDLATKVVTSAIAEITSQRGPEIRYQVVEGYAARVLVDRSADADLLVVGNRGHGGFVEALLGSTGQHCVHHATCPVVVIREPASV